MAEPADQSHLDRKYFIDRSIYNCPFCNRRHVAYTLEASFWFSWSNAKYCYVYFVKCDSCKKSSMHLSFESLTHQTVFGSYGSNSSYMFKDGIEIDSKIFYSAPTSFFVLDDRVPGVIRELITEAEGSRKMNFLTGASACARKAIYEFLVHERAEGDHYEDQIKSLKRRYSGIDAELFDVLSHIQDMTSDKVHEQSWPKWDSQNLTLIIEALKAILYEVYVLPKEKAARSSKIQELLQKIRGKAKASEEVLPVEPPGEKTS